MGTKEKKSRIGAGRFLAWNSRAVSLAVQVVLIGYVQVYCTDVLGLAPGLVGTLLLGTKLVDGFTDLFAGYLVDKTNTKIGRGRPYEIAIIGVWLCSWLVFSVPAGYSTAVKCVWVVLAYTMAQSVCATLLNANQTAYMVRAFNDQQHYVTLSSLGGLVTVVGVAAFNVIFPSMMAKAGTDAPAWSRMILMIAAPLAVIGIMRFLFVKEKYNVDIAGADRVSAKEVGALLKHNRYIYFVAAVTLVYQLVSGFGVSVYYYKYIVGDLELMGIMSLFSLAAMLTMVFYPAILKKLTPARLIQAGCVCYGIGGIVIFAAKDNAVLLAVSSLLTGIGSLPIAFLMQLLIIDCADYNEWEGRPRMEGTLGCVNGFAMKLGSALGTWLCGVLLSASGYAGAAEVQSASAAMMIRVMQGLIPAALYFLIGLLLFRYGLDGKMVQIRRENEARRLQAEPAEAAHRS